jgi:hypothetical protein
MVLQLIADGVTTVKTTGVNWNAVGALSAPTIFIVSVVGNGLSRKLNKIGAHLERQDTRGRRQDRRLSRIEAKLELPPMMFTEDD